MARRYGIIVIGILLIFLLRASGISNTLKGSVAEFLKYPGRFIEQVCKNFSDLFHFRDIALGNRRLKEEVGALKIKVAELKEASLENERLRGLLNFKERLPRTFLPAEVIGYDSHSLRNSIIIDKGFEDNIEVNIPVISFGGLAGRISEVYSTTSRVLLISDPNSKVAVFTQQSRESGLLVGLSTDRCAVEYLDIDSDVQEGETVISSGMGGIFPKGLVIGRIKALRRRSGGLFKFADIELLVDLSALEEVVCLVE